MGLLNSNVLLDNDTKHEQVIITAVYYRNSRPDTMPIGFEVVQTLGTPCHCLQFLSTTMSLMSVFPSFLL